jgi:hypothetical protein
LDWDKTLWFSLSSSSTCRLQDASFFSSWLYSNTNTQIEPFSLACRLQVIRSSDSGHLGHYILYWFVFFGLLTSWKVISCSLVLGFINLLTFLQFKTIFLAYRLKDEVTFHLQLPLDLALFAVWHVFKWLLSSISGRSSWKVIPF